MASVIIQFCSFSIVLPQNFKGGMKGKVPSRPLQPSSARANHLILLGKLLVPTVFYITARFY